MPPASACHPCLWATSNSKIVSSQRGPEGELWHRSHDANGLGAVGTSEPALGAEQREGGGQGPGVQWKVPHFFNSCKNCKEWVLLLPEPRELVVPAEPPGRASSAQRRHFGGKQHYFPEAVEEAGRDFGLATGIFQAAAAGKFAASSVSLPV